MREITTHVVNPVNDKLKIMVCDDPGAGGANHLYAVDGADWSANPSMSFETPPGLVIPFQNGPINEAGINGVTQEVLLAIVADRLECFQAGPFACKENGKALADVLSAMDWLASRTRARMDRGVEGRNVA